MEYATKVDTALFKAPLDVTDARILSGEESPGIPLNFFPELASKIFPTVNQLPIRIPKVIENTKIYFAALAPYEGPSLDELKSFCEKKYGLTNIQVLNSIPLYENAFDSVQMQYAGGELLDNALLNLIPHDSETTHDYFIVFTSKPIYSKVTNKTTSLLSNNNNAIVSFSKLRPLNSIHIEKSAERILARTLGSVYWKYPPTSVPQDLMYQEVKNTPEDFDRMQLDFHEDKSLEFAELGVAKELLGSHQEAEAAFTEAINYNPLNSKLYYQLAQVEYNEGKYQATVQSTDKALLLSAMDEPTYELQGDAFEKLGNPRRAVWEYNAALTFNPTDSKLLDKLKDALHQVEVH